MKEKIGLLLPRSVIYPSIGFDLLAGLKCGLEDAGINNFEIKTESIGLGTDDKVIYGSCEKLLFDGVNIVAGYVNPTTAEKLEPLFAGANAVFIALDAGYHFPSSTRKLPHIFYLSLQGALCARTAIKIAMEDGMKNLAFAGSFYDSGYRSSFAFHRGVEEGGGQVTYNLITPLKRSELSLGPLEAHFKETKVDAVFASFCGDMLQDLFTAASAGNVFKNHAVYGSSFAGEEHWLAQSPYPGIDIKVCVPWAAALDNEQNVHFTGQLKKDNKKANIFSLLGWETAKVAAEFLSATDTGEAIASLEGFSFDSPRGVVVLDAATHQCHAPVYEAWIEQNDETGNCVLVLEKESTHTVEQRQRLENDINTISGTMSSWFNAYPCLDS
jgi:branched-chain amino acid transport system substrate-binding protein